MKKELQERIKYLYNKLDEKYLTEKEIAEVTGIIERLEIMMNDLYDTY